MKKEYDAAQKELVAAKKKGDLHASTSLIF